MLLTATRAYNPVLGRFIGRDSIEEQGGLNLYTYVGNNPISFVDPLGLDAGYPWMSDPNAPQWNPSPPSDDDIALALSALNLGLAIVDLPLGAMAGKLRGLGRRPPPTTCPVRGQPPTEPTPARPHPDAPYSPWTPPGKPLPQTNELGEIKFRSGNQSMPESSDTAGNPEWIKHENPFGGWDFGNEKN